MRAAIATTILELLRADGYDARPTVLQTKRPIVDDASFQRVPAGTIPVIDIYRDDKLRASVTFLSPILDVSTWIPNGVRQQYHSHALRYEDPELIEAILALVRSSAEKSAP